MDAVPEFHIRICARLPSLCPSTPSCRGPCTQRSGACQLLLRALRNGGWARWRVCFRMIYKNNKIVHLTYDYCKRYLLIWQCFGATPAWAAWFHATHWVVPAAGWPWYVMFQKGECWKRQTPSLFWHILMLFMATLSPVLIWFALYTALQISRKEKLCYTFECRMTNTNSPISSFTNLICYFAKCVLIF